jgi:hypothetical protein
VLIASRAPSPEEHLVRLLVGARRQRSRCAQVRHRLREPEAGFGADMGRGDVPPTIKVPRHRSCARTRRCSWPRSGPWKAPLGALHAQGRRDRLPSRAARGRTSTRCAPASRTCARQKTVRILAAHGVAGGGVVAIYRLSSLRQRAPSAAPPWTNVARDVRGRGNCAVSHVFGAVASRAALEAPWPRLVNARSPSRGPGAPAARLRARPARSREDKLRALSNRRHVDTARARSSSRPSLQREKQGAALPGASAMAACPILHGEGTQYSPVARPGTQKGCAPSGFAFPIREIRLLSRRRIPGATGGRHHGRLPGSARGPAYRSIDVDAQ